MRNTFTPHYNIDNLFFKCFVWRRLIAGTVTFRSCDGNMMAEIMDAFFAVIKNKSLHSAASSMRDYTC